MDVDGALRARRPTTRACPDWTERRTHLAGALGAAIGTRFLAAGWVVRHPAGRGLSTTDSGRELLRDAWGIEPGDLVGEADAAGGAGPAP